MTMSRKEIEKKYEEVARKICVIDEEREKGRREVEKEMEDKISEREMERRVWGRFRTERKG